MHDGRTRKVEMTEVEARPSFLNGNRASLTVLRGPAAGTEWALDRGHLVLGRAAEADLVLEDDSISSEHAAFSAGSDGFTVRDLASTNGVKVNGAEVLASELKHGDRVELGRCELQYVVEACDRAPRAWDVDPDS